MKEVNTARYRPQRISRGNHTNQEEKTMKTTLTVLSFIATLAITGLAMATTWTVVNNANNFDFGNGNTYTATLDLGTVGFNSADTITSAQLLLDFLGTGTVTKVVYDATTDSGNHDIFLGSDLAYTVATSTLSDGKLNLSIKGNDSILSFLLGDLKLADATLTANGSEPAPPPAQEPAAVPEPGTMMLLGAGFLGLSIYSKRRKNA